jgi:hypothetical protein
MPMIRDRVLSMAGAAAAPDINPDECVAVGGSLAGVLRHQPDHPALKRVRQGLADQARARQAAELDAMLDEDDAAPAPAEHPADGSPAASPPQAPSSEHDDTQRLGPALNNPPVIPMLPPAMPAEGELTDPGIPAVEIRDASTHPLGVIALGDALVPKVVTMIPAATPIPCERRARFAYAFDDMTAVQVEVCEGHGTAREEVTVIGAVVLEDLPPRPRGTPIDVIYRYTVDARLEVDVVDVETGATRQAEVHLTGATDADAVDSAAAQISETTVR